MNDGCAPQTGFTVGYTLDGVAITPEVFSGTIAALDTVVYSFTNMANFTSAGKLDIEAYTMLAGDIDLSNDTVIDEVNKTYLIDSYPYLETFATGEQGWSIENGANGSWVFGEPNKPSIVGAASDTNAFVTNLTGSHNLDEDAFVYSPCFDFSTLENPYVQMSTNYNSYTGDGVIFDIIAKGAITGSEIGNNLKIKEGQIVLKVEQSPLWTITISDNGGGISNDIIEI